MAASPQCTQCSFHFTTVFASSQHCTDISYYPPPLPLVHESSLLDGFQNRNPARLQITDFLEHHLLDLVAVLLIHVLAGVLRLVGLECLLVALVADLSGLVLAVLGVPVLLSLLGTSLHLELADPLWLEIAVPLLN